MKLIALLAVGAVCFAGSEGPVSMASLKAVETSINDRLRSDINDPYDFLAPARGTYLQGYGAVFTVQIGLVVIPPLFASPFSPKPTAAELTKLHDRKLHKVGALKDLMRSLMTAAACQSLPGLAPDDRVVMEAFLFDYGWEDTANLPHRIMITGQKQKIAEAVGRHAPAPELAGLFQEQIL